MGHLLSAGVCMLHPFENQRVCQEIAGPALGTEAGVGGQADQGLRQGMVGINEDLAKSQHASLFLLHSFLLHIRHAFD